MNLTSVRDEVPEGCEYKLITTEDALDELCRQIMAAPLVAVDTETEGLAFGDVIVGICISTAPFTGAYIPMRHEIVEGQRHPDQLPVDLILTKLKPALEYAPCTGHNIKFDWKMLWKDGIDCNFIHCTLIEAALIGHYEKKGLKPLTEYHFDHQMMKLEHLFPVPKGRKKVQIRPKELSPEDILIYAVEDADYSLRLHHILNKEMTSGLKRVSSLLYKLELRLARVIAEMEMWGVPVDSEFLEVGASMVSSMLLRLNDEIHKEVRHLLGDSEYTLNLNSTAQLGELLFDKLGMPVRQFTPAGKPAVAGAVLKELAKDYDIVERILTYRKIHKLRSFYEKMIEATEDDGRIRGSFNQVGTASGRFSSKDPNLQQIPRDQTFILWPMDESEDFLHAEFPDKVRRNCEDGTYSIFSDDSNKWEDEYGYLGEAPNGKGYGVEKGRLMEMHRFKTRKFIAASKDHYIIEADYSQIELRIMAGESKEPTLLDAYEKGDDVHQRTASVIFGIPFENVTKEQRSTGKTINFGLLYGAGPQRIGKELNISTYEAKEIVDRYFQNLPSIKNWINRSKESARRDKFSRTRIGRVRFFPKITSRDQALKAREEREAVNHLIQGSAADVMKFSLVQTSKAMKKYFGDRVKLICTVHDSLILEVHDSVQVEEAVWALKQAMEGFTMCAEWPEMKIDPAVGSSWGDTVPFKGDGVEPSVDETESLSTIRVRMVGLEREGLAEVPEDPNPPAEIVEIDVEEVLAEEEVIVAEDSSWIIEVKNSLTIDRLNRLKTFLESKKVENGYSAVLYYPDSSGNDKKSKLPGEFSLNKEDEGNLQIILGPCILRQELGTLDPMEVTRGMVFGS